MEVVVCEEIISSWLMNVLIVISFLLGFYVFRKMSKTKSCQIDSCKGPLPLNNNDDDVHIDNEIISTGAD
jgi:hypothetical protein